MRESDFEEILRRLKRRSRKDRLERLESLRDARIKFVGCRGSWLAEIEMRCGDLLDLLYPSPTQGDCPPP